MKNLNSQFETKTLIVETYPAQSSLPEDALLSEAETCRRTNQQVGDNSLWIE